MQDNTRVSPQIKAQQSHCGNEEAAGHENVIKFKKRMLEWSNPVEYVNNMYGAHPDDDDGREYFKAVFAK